MVTRVLLSVAGYEDALKLLDDTKKKEIIKILEDEARLLLATGFDEPLELGIPIEISKRMRHCRGLFYYKNSKEAKVIRLSHELVIGSILDNNFETLLDALRHEVVHYALFLMGKEFDDNTYMFQSTVERLGISSNSFEDLKLTHYYLIDTYTCTSHPLMNRETSYTKTERIIMCPLCKKRFARTETGIYKYFPCSPVFPYLKNPTT